MKLRCPICQSKFSLEQAVHEEKMHELVELASRFGRNWELVCEYIDCFRQGQYGSVTLKKRVRLLKELWKLFEKNEFEYDGKRYRTDWARTLAGMEIVVSMDNFGFKNHNYLKSVLLKEAEKVSAEGLTAREESRRERERQTTDGRGQTTEDGEETMTAEEHKRNLGIVGDLVDQIGSKAGSKERSDEG